MGKSLLQRYPLFASGFVSKGSLGGVGVDEGFGEIILAALLGAFCGLMFGLMLSRLVHFFSFLMGRQVSSHTCVIASTLLGAAFVACWAAFGDGAEASFQPTEGIAEN